MTHTAACSVPKKGRHVPQIHPYLRRRSACARIGGSLAPLFPDTAPEAKAVACGVFRWPVKTLSDRRAKRVNYHPINSSVGFLRGLV